MRSFSYMLNKHRKLLYIVLGLVGLGGLSLGIYRYSGQLGTDLAEPHLKPYPAASEPELKPFPLEAVELKGFPEKELKPFPKQLSPGKPIQTARVNTAPTVR